ncbi:hypothetical protein Salat_2507500 [Sesamum alatum]|uniref:Uncharacterized protein n=1 Tax=Sesamum alatum TaxID=300844 RepID=A0AAE1XRN3_9LAMI|nr:hypothetical protein Salat_2507500 [Sesamum alatum]
MEKIFSDVLVQQIELRLAKPGYRVAYLIRSAMQEVNKVYGMSFDYRYFEDKVRRLYEHFLEFPWAMFLSDVMYDTITEEASKAFGTQLVRYYFPLHHLIPNK